ncbi:MAG: RNase adapter RapZ [Gammaproteobacteria bacterium]|nr:RNase adapter RapZ [Gammaproteobacteria bacterium]
MIIVSGLSGAGKTVALHTLEDSGYYCIDNLPSALLPALFEQRQQMKMPMAVGIDIRNQLTDGSSVPQMIKDFKESHPDNVQLLFLTAKNDVLLKRFSESRRKHPLASPKITLKEALEKEVKTLAPLYVTADYQIDTSRLSVYDLKDRIQSWLAHSDTDKTTLTIESFGFKHGSPTDSDLLFDVRFLPNPYWEADLRQFTGQDKPIQDYLASFSEPADFINDTVEYLSKWLPTYLSGYRSYLTIGIGCTGGKHRSVYVTEKIAEKLGEKFGHINVRHRDLPKANVGGDVKVGAGDGK